MGELLNSIFDFAGKVIVFILFFVVVLIVLVAVVPERDQDSTSKGNESCNHQWIEATCTEGRVCSLCGGKSGEPLGHYWMEATLYTPKTCVRCDMTMGKSTVVWADYFADSFSDTFAYECTGEDHELTFSYIADKAVFMSELYSLCVAVGEYWSHEGVEFTIIVDGTDGFMDWVFLCFAAPETPPGVAISAHNVLSRQLGNDLDALYNEWFETLK